MVSPNRMNFKGVRPVSDAAHTANVRAAARLPRFLKGSVDGSRPLALVGGGPSVADQLDTLRGWPGDIWAINWTCAWLSDNGIAAKMVTLDASIKSVPRAALCQGALIASCCQPSLLAEYADVGVYDLAEDAPGGVDGGSSTACRAPVLAFQMGYREVHLFGVEGSFPDGQTHVDRHETQFKNLLKVQAGDQIYLTRDDLYLQCEWLADAIRTVPDRLINRAGGLLQGMVDNPDDWGVVAVSNALAAKIRASGPRPPDVRIGSYPYPFFMY